MTWTYFYQLWTKELATVQGHSRLYSEATCSISPIAGASCKWNIHISDRWLLQKCKKVSLSVIMDREKNQISSIILPLQKDKKTSRVTRHILCVNKNYKILDAVKHCRRHHIRRHEHNQLFAFEHLQPLSGVITENLTTELNFTISYKIFVANVLD